MFSNGNFIIILSTYRIHTCRPLRANSRKIINLLFGIRHTHEDERKLWEKLKRGNSKNNLNLRPTLSTSRLSFSGVLHFLAKKLGGSKERGLCIIFSFLFPLHSLLIWLPLAMSIFTCILFTFAISSSTSAWPFPTPTPYFLRLFSFHIVYFYCSCFLLVIFVVSAAS